MRRPLVLDPETARVRQSRSSEDLRIPLDERVTILQAQFDSLLFWMIEQRFDIPEELAKLAKPWTK